MLFERRPVAETEHTILVHSIRLKDLTLKKGKKISAADITQLRDAGVESIVVAALQDGDIGEDQAAGILAGETTGANLETDQPFTGRCNLYTTRPGLLVINHTGVDQINGVHESLTLATLAPYSTVTGKQLVATAKIIPFAVTKRHLVSCLQAARNHFPVLSVAPFAGGDVGLIQTSLPGMRKSILEKTLKVLCDRLEPLAYQLSREIRCGHDQREVCTALVDLIESGVDIIVISSASAIADRRDIVPMAVNAAGGEVVHFGMPVDPGNLLLYARIGRVPVLGMPGCARSPKLNGFDFVLQRLAAGLNISARDIMNMGVGGLLHEIANRPLPREKAER